MSKPEVQFLGQAAFDTALFPGHEVAHVMAADHPILGRGVVRTSKVINKFEDGSFETMNTLYKPFKYETENTSTD